MSLPLVHSIHVSRCSRLQQLHGQAATKPRDVRGRTLIDWRTEMHCISILRRTAARDAPESLSTTLVPSVRPEIEVNWNV